MGYSDTRNLAIHRVRILGAPVDNMTMQEAVDRACELVAADGSSLGTTLNVDILKHYSENGRFKRIFDEADMILMDGAPLQKLSQRTNDAVVAKVSGPDFLPELCRSAARLGYSCYILGGREGVPERAANRLQELVPNLRVAGVCSPPFGFEADPDLSKEIASSIASAGPDILFVCLGTPKSELWIDAWKHELNVPLSFSLGAAVDFIAGNVKRAPHWMSKHGLEWLYRISQDPKRLIGRYAKDLLFLLKAAGRYHRDE